jgi:hypothetical protein
MYLKKLHASLCKDKKMIYMLGEVDVNHLHLPSQHWFKPTKIKIKNVPFNF